MEKAKSGIAKVQTELQKSTSAQEFDALFLMDNLSLAEATGSGAEDSPVVNNGLPMAGSTYPKAVLRSKGQQPKPHTFNECESSSFQLRVGPNYAKTGAKAPGGLSLYEVVGMDFVRCEERIDDFASKVNLPAGWCNIDTHHEGIPQLFIVNVQLPEDFSTSFFTTKDNGLGWSLVIFFRIRQETADALKNLASAPPPVKLFAQYCMEAPEYFAAVNHNSTSAKGNKIKLPEGPNPWAGRFKIILRCEDIEQFGLPSFITAYNSKPVLIRNTGTLVRGAHYVEMDINVHKFASLPKRALEVLFHRFDKMVISAGFCIESRTDDEMPEALFGAAQINFPTYQMTPQWPL